jgi:hypothetical protein
LVRTHTVHISGVVRTVPLVGGGPFQLAGVVPYNAAFHATASGGAGGPYIVTWNFGDGTSGNGTNTTHLYTTPGNFTALATATDRLGDPGTATFAVRVYNVTYVNVTVLGVPRSVLPSTPLNVAVHGSALCNGDSVPGCRLANASFQVGFITADGQPVTFSPPIDGNRSFSSRNWDNFTIPAPPSGGSYAFTLSFVSPAYVGGLTMPLNVTSPAATGNGLYPLGDAPAAAALGVAIVIGLIVGVVAHRRRPRNESEPAAAAS